MIRNYLATKSKKYLLLLIVTIALLAAAIVAQPPLGTASAASQCSQAPKTDSLSAVCPDYKDNSILTVRSSDNKSRQISISLVGGSGGCQNPRFFGLIPWYEYLPRAVDGVTHECEITNFKVLGSSSSFLLIILAVVDDLLRIAGMVAVIFLIIGGIKYITSSGNPEQAAGAKSTITYAIIGLVIAIFTVVIVGFIGHTLGA